MLLIRTLVLTIILIKSYRRIETIPRELGATAYTIILSTARSVRLEPMVKVIRG
jgi:hypothetical protein